MGNYDYYDINYIDLEWKIKVQGTSSLSNTHFIASDASNAFTSTQECTTPQCMQFESGHRENKRLQKCQAEEFSSLISLIYSITLILSSWEELVVSR